MQAGQNSNLQLMLFTDVQKRPAFITKALRIMEAIPDILIDSNTNRNRINSSVGSLFQNYFQIRTFKRGIMDH